MSTEKFWSWNNLKNEIIFSSGTILSFCILLTIGSMGYWALVVSLMVILATTTYFSITFFDRPSSNKLYFYFITLFLLIGYFALVYKNFGTIPPGQTGTEQLNWLDSLYFSVVTWTTLGYGDFRPGTDTVKLFVMTEALLGYVYMGMLIGKILLLGQSKKSQ